ncbi:MAG: LON peptidase substrate-binding domain-containing protein, partial [Bacteroidales bacterium]|nr:LON peptidase substrate-binding domain-containing protein [Bacteroidales bacterium]
MSKKIDTNLFFPNIGAEVNIIPVLQGEGSLKFDPAEMPDVIPILALRNAVIFPGAVYPVTIGRPKSLQLIADAEKSGALIGAVPQIDVTVEDPQKEDLLPYGTVVRIVRTLEMPDGTVTAILQGLKRFSLDYVVTYDPYIRARVHCLDDFLTDDSVADRKMIMNSLKDKAIQIMRNSNLASKEAQGALRSINDFGFLVNFIAT